MIVNPPPPSTLIFIRLSEQPHNGIDTDVLNINPSLVLNIASVIGISLSGNLPHLQGLYLYLSV